MSFTYSSDLTISRDFVRFHTGDTVETESFLSDEIITSLLATESSQQYAVIAALKYILARLSQPNFKADWLSIDLKSARQGYEMILSEKRLEFGIAQLTGQVTHVYRSDSGLTEAPDYSDGRP
jgi:hypothetical protein